MTERNRRNIKSIKKLAKELRRNLTESEILLWQYLRNRRLSGHKFLRQHPIIYKADYLGLNYFIADFYCDSKKTVIELDGSVHIETVEYDLFRDKVMREKGLHVLRIKNEELSNINNVIEKIKTYLLSIS
jgi:very-short-patch-repair endonuclease